jgi:DNA-binding transcriptional ArsR family regulator
MMPDLVEGPSPIEVSFSVSLAHSLLATVSLVCAVPSFEGLGEWLLEARAKLVPAQLAELCLLVGFPGHIQRFTAELAASLPAEAPELDQAGLMAHLERIPGDEYSQMALRALARGSSPRPGGDELRSLMDQPTEWAGYLAQIGSQVAPEVVAGLVRDGEGLKSWWLSALERFWNDVYSTEFEATRPLMERSVAYQQSRPRPTSFDDLFAEVTGRLAPEQFAQILPTVESVTFVPSCYVGPYVAYTHFDSQLILYYNCRSAPLEDGGAGREDTTALYPPLKALADETRLEIVNLLRDGELYAQEIVEHLGISQPAVSRHLTLMAAAGVLRIRRDGNAKYYALDRETLNRLARSLQRYARQP